MYTREKAREIIDDLLGSVIHTLKMHLKTEPQCVFVYNNLEEYVDYFIPQFDLRMSVDLLGCIMAVSEREPAIFYNVHTEKMTYGEHITQVVRSQLALMTSQVLMNDVEFCELLVEHHNDFLKVVDVQPMYHGLVSIRENNRALFDSLLRNMARPLTQAHLDALKDGNINFTAVETISNICSFHHFSPQYFGIPSEICLRSLESMIGVRGEFGHNTGWDSVYKNAVDRLGSSFQMKP